MTKLAPSTLFFAGVQWLFFMFANTVVVPLTVSSAFHLSLEETVASMQRSFIITGLACILQAKWGHRYALMEGHSGLWWGLILSLTTFASSTGVDLATLGGGLATGMIISGILTALLGYMGLAHVLKKIMSPIVMGVFLLLLSCQLILIFLKGAVGLADGDYINLPVAGLSVLIALLVAWLSLQNRGKLSNFSILIGIVVGWIAYEWIFPDKGALPASTGTLFTLFPWGKPNLEMGIVFIGMLTGLINTMNTVTACKGAEVLYSTTTSNRKYQSAFLITGFHSVISGIFGIVPSAPYASTLGFLQSTRIIERTPMIVGAVLFMIMGVSPTLATFFSTMPMSVGNSVLFIAYLQLFGAGLRNIEGISFSPKTIYRIAAPVLLGISIMGMPSEVYREVPMFIQPLLSNGLLVGTILSMVLENTLDWSKYEVHETVLKKAG